MNNKQLPAVYEEVIIEETVNKEDKKKENIFLSKVLTRAKRILFITILVLFVGISARLFIQNKITDAKNMRLTTQIEEMEDSMNTLQSKLDAAEQKRFNRVEVETVQIMKELLAVSDLTTYTYKYTNETTESDTRILPIVNWDIWGTTNTVTVKYSGVINVGYDMNDIKYDLSKEDKAIYVTLPEPMVLDNYIELDDMSCSSKNNPLNPIKIDVVIDYLKTIEAEELEKAEANDIYNKADEQLKQIINGYFGVFPDYEVIYI